MNVSSPRGGFDAVAERYDADEFRNPVLVHMRGRILHHLFAAFAPGTRLIEIGSGTGTEAGRLVCERNCRVALVDVSPRLLERAATKVRGVRPDGLLGAHLLRADSVGQLVTIYGQASFDGAYSSLGPLNCEPLLDPIAAGFGELVRRDGALVLSVINRWCPVEVGWFAIHGQWREASRRWGGRVQASAYAGGPRDVEALPLLWPPPYLDFLVARFPTFFRAIEPLETWAARQPILRDLGDHVLIRLRRH